MADVGLTIVAQDDFSAGMVPSMARHLIPGAGVWDIENGLLDDDGSVYERGGTVYKSSAAFGAGLRWVWEAQFPEPIGARTLFANSADFGVLAANDATVVNLGGPGLNTPVRAAMIGGLLFIGGGTIYGGSRKTGAYSTGTVTMTAAGAIITGSGTSWSANVDAGMLFRHGAERVYVVKSVDSNTQITLTEPYGGATDSGEAYTLSPLETATTPYVTSDAYAVAGGRLWAIDGNKLRFSSGPDPLTGAPRPHDFPIVTPGSTHELAEGSELIGIEGLRDRLLAFTTRGLWQISNIAFDAVSPTGQPQHRIERVSTDLVMWGPAGAAQWHDSLVVAAVDGVYLLDGVSAPVLLSRAVTPRIVDSVAGGNLPGGAAVFRSHLLLPVLDSEAAAIEVLVCRLDREVRTRQGIVFPWTRAGGHAGAIAAFATRFGEPGTSRTPVLLAGARGTDARVLDCSAFFEPGEDVDQDADGSTHNATIILRDIETGGRRNSNLVRRVRVRYELVGGVLQGATSDGREQTSGARWDEVNWDEFVWAAAEDAEYVILRDSAPESDGRRPKAWPCNRHVRFLRVRLRTSGPVTRFTLRSVELFVSPSGKAS